MKVLVCGGRDYNDYERMKEILSALDITEVIHGSARGADSLAGRFAREQGIHETTYQAQWDKYGKSAGPIRNAQMLVEGKPDLVVAFPTHRSRGTRHTIKTAGELGIRCIVDTDQKTTKD